MNFRRHARREDPEINFIPLIDLLLVILIFLMVTTTFSRLSQLRVELPESGAAAPAQRQAEITVTIDADGQHAVDGELLGVVDPARLAARLRKAAQSEGEHTLVVRADANASHRQVMQVLEAARLAGVERVSFATRSLPAGASGAATGAASPQTPKPTPNRAPNPASNR